MLDKIIHWLRSIFDPTYDNTPCSIQIRVENRDNKPFVSFKFKPSGSWTEPIELKRKPQTVDLITNVDVGLAITIAGEYEETDEEGITWRITQQEVSYAKSSRI